MYGLNNVCGTFNKNIIFHYVYHMTQFKFAFIAFKVYMYMYFFQTWFVVIVHIGDD